MVVSRYTSLPISGREFSCSEACMGGSLPYYQELFNMKKRGKNDRLHAFGSTHFGGKLYFNTSALVVSSCKQLVPFHSSVKIRRCA